MFSSSRYFDLQILVALLPSTVALAQTSRFQLPDSMPSVTRSGDYPAEAACWNPRYGDSHSTRLRAWQSSRKGCGISAPTVEL